MPPVSTRMSKKIIKIVVGSKNPVKVNAVQSAFASLYEDCEIQCEGMHAPSGVSDQPMDSEETREGAINRVAFCKSQIDADFYVAMEGGVDLFIDGPATFAYIAIADKDRMSVGHSAILPLPAKVYAALEAGDELGDVMDNMFGTDNIKQKGGAIALLTNGQSSRESNYNHAILCTMAPFLHGELFGA